MALDINGYNATFKAFADFAKTQMDAGNEKAVDRALGAPSGTKFVPYVGEFNSDEISATAILDDLTS